MTSLPSGLASISSRLDDSPQVRGAVAFGRMVREVKPGGGIGGSPSSRETLTSDIDRHAALILAANLAMALTAQRLP